MRILEAVSDQLTFQQWAPEFSDSASGIESESESQGGSNVQVNCRPWLNIRNYIRHDNKNEHFRAPTTMKWMILNQQAACYKY